MVDWSNLAELIENKIPLREIARIKGCGHTSVRKAINRFSLPYTITRKETMKLVAKRDGLSEKMKGNLFAIEKGKTHEDIRIGLTCDWCSIGFIRLESKAKNYKHHFCSKNCRAKWNGEKISNDMAYKEKCRQISKENGLKPPVHLGSNHWNWKGGISMFNRGQDYGYIQWRKDVLVKYNFICQICGERGGKLSAHHIIPWSECEELRYDINNGVCYCYDCHMEFHGLKKK